jgi:hypothetical protein
MKTVYKYSCFLLLFLPLFFSHCGKKGSEPTPAQVVTIADMWVGNVTDYDGDGYVSYFNLYFDLNINSGSKEAYILLAIRFYDSADTATYFELFSTENFTIEGNTDDDALYLDVELPSNTFPATGYDFLFLVVDSDNPEQRLAEMSATDLELLSNFPLEHIDDDLVVTLDNMWISDTVDTDLDGYNSSFHFNFDLNAAGGSKDVFVLLAARPYDPSDKDPYFSYFTSADFTVAGNVLDVKYLNIDNSDAFFPQGNYDFLFIVFDSSDPEVRLVEVSASDTPMLRSIPLEPTDTENKIMIWDAWFDDQVDIDGDGYDSEAWLVFDIDEENGSGEDVYIDISYKTSSSQNFVPLVTTEVFTVTGAADDPRGIEVTNYHNFNHESYDFKLELKFAGYDQNIEDQSNHVTDTDLGSVNLELSSEDDPQELSLRNIWPSELLDNDRDGYYSIVVISTDIDVSYGEADVYMKVYYKISTESNYTYLGDTNQFHLSEDSPNDVYSIQFSNFSHGLWDLRFEVYFVGSSNVELTFDESNEPDLNNIFMETGAEDPLP